MSLATQYAQGALGGDSFEEWILVDARCRVRTSDILLVRQALYR